MKENTIINGLCLDVIKTFDNESIDCVITSPPYWQLRDYGYSEQWGLEPTYEQYLYHLWELMDEVWRVLKPAGTAWINLGDTYGTQSGNMANPIPSKETRHANESIEIKQPKSITKCLLLIPHRFAIGCIDRGWLVRNDIIWAKRNAMPEPVNDRFSKKHEYMFLMSKKQKYYFDIEPIRDKVLKPEAAGTFKNRKPNKYFEGAYTPNEKGKNPGSVSDFWDIPTKGSSDKHYAQFNFSLIEKPIMAGCPKDGIILDPFCGGATTGVRALQLNRKFIGIEASKEYYKLADYNLKRELNQLKLF